MSFASGAMSVMVPRMFDVCVHATSRVFGVRSLARSSGTSFGFEVVLAEGTHHLIVRLRQAASWIQEAMLASWSSLLRMISSVGRVVRAVETLRKSWVVLLPKTISEGWALM